MSPFHVAGSARERTVLFSKRTSIYKQLRIASEALELQLAVSWEFTTRPHGLRRRTATTAQLSRYAVVDIVIVIVIIRNVRRRRGCASIASRQWSDTKREECR